MNVGEQNKNNKNTIRIVSFNVNGLKAVLNRFYGPSGTITRFLQEDFCAEADIVCLQETKLRKSELLAAVHQLAVDADGLWDSFFSCAESSRGYSGTATFVRNKKCLPFHAELGFTGLNRRDKNNAATGNDVNVCAAPHPEFLTTIEATFSEENTFTVDELRTLDSEGRVVVTDHQAFVLFNIYGPAVTSSDPEQAQSRLHFKMRFYHALQRRWRALRSQGRAVIAVGDFNIAPAPIDQAETASMALHVVEEKYYPSTRPDRIWLRNVLGNGVHTDLHCKFTDCFRYFHPNRGDAYTVWSTTTGARVHNYGSRIDLTLSSGLIVGCPSPNSQHGDSYRSSHWFVSNADIQPHVHGSDHAPVFLEIGNVHNHGGGGGNEDELSSSLLLLFPCASTPPPEAMRYANKQVKLYSWLTTRGGGGLIHNSVHNNDDMHEKQQQTIQKTRVCTEERIQSRIQALVSGSSTGRTVSAMNPSSRSRQLSLTSFVTSTDFSNPKQQTEGTSSSLKVSESSKEIDAKGDGGQRQGCTVGAKDAWQAIQRRMQTPKCNHGDPAALKQVNKGGPNQGRWFYMCARAKGNGPHAQCSFFQWVQQRPGDAKRTKF